MRPSIARVAGSSRPGIVVAPAIGLVLAAACWGAGTVTSKQAVAELPPLTLLVVQLATSVVLLLAVSRWGARPFSVHPEDRLLGRLGLLNPGLAYALSLVGLTEITASMSVLLWAAEPILILALATVVLGERPGLSLAVLSVVAIGGLLLVVFDPAAGGSAVGVGLTIAGVGMCAVYTVAARRWLPRATDSTFGVVLRQQAHALGLAVVIVAGIGLAGGRVLPVALTPGGLASGIASGVLYYALAYWFYLSALRRVGASLAAASFYLIPVFGVGLGWLAGERLQPLQWLGAALVVVAVAAISVRATRTQPA